MKTECMGCHIQDRGCLIKDKIKLVDMCPCVNCLLKPICTTQCDERKRIYREHYKFKY